MSGIGILVLRSDAYAASVTRNPNDKAPMSAPAFLAACFFLLFLIPFLAVRRRNLRLKRQYAAMHLETEEDSYVPYGETSSNGMGEQPAGRAVDAGTGASSSNTIDINSKSKGLNTTTSSSSSTGSNSKNKGLETTTASSSSSSGSGVGTVLKPARSTPATRPAASGTSEIEPLTLTTAAAARSSAAESIAEPKIAKDMRQGHATEGVPITPAMAATAAREAANPYPGGAAVTPMQQSAAVPAPTLPVSASSSKVDLSLPQQSEAVALPALPVNASSSKVDSSLPQLLASVLGRAAAGEVLMLMHQGRQAQGAGRVRRRSHLQAYKGMCKASYTSVKVRGKLIIMGRRMVKMEGNGLYCMEGHMVSTNTPLMLSPGPYPPCFLIRKTMVHAVGWRVFDTSHRLWN